MTQAMDRRAERRKLDARLDEALAETFPASDPFSVGQFTATEPPSRPVDRKAVRVRPGGPPAPRRRAGQAQRRPKTA